ncbi:MAG: hypothetical protein QXI33_03690 [Candidatus Pacearchaeota archaeon]
MNKKRVYSIIFFLCFVLSLNFVFSQSNSTLNTEDTKIEKAYQCIKDKIDKDCTKLTSEEQVFSLLSVGDYEDCKNEFLKNSNNNECWPKSNCKLKETSIALLALDNIGENTDKIQSWILNQTKIASDLIWYLEVDTDGTSSCYVKYDLRNYNFDILSDKKISSGAGNCLSISENGYWLKISSTCLDKSYTISCDKDFTTTLLYRTQDSEKIYVSQNVHSSVKGGETEEKVIFKCFKQGSVCDYEGSLWAAIALNKKGADTSEFLPYLDAFRENNKGFFPEAFLYILTGSNDFLTSVLSDNFKGKFWQVGSYNKFYNTALAFMALGDQSSTESQQAKNYLLTSQDQNGCWGNVKDTGFLLYTGWPRTFSKPSNECRDDADCLSGQTCVNGICRTTGGGRQDCESSGYFCEKFSDCLSISGTKLDDYTCSYTSKICCSKKFEIQDCVSQNGYLCNQGESCNGQVIPSSNLQTCCSTQCEKNNPEEPEVTDTCTPRGDAYRCRSICNEDESEYSGAQCSVGNICCLKKQKSYFWIWLLLILIVIVIILIIFRNKVRLLLFRLKSGFKKGPPPSQTRPPFLPPGSGKPMMPPYIRPLPRMPPGPVPVRNIGREKEFDETLKKLKEMSK